MKALKMKRSGAVTMATLFLGCTVSPIGSSQAVADDKWDQAYESLLKQRPAIAAKVESGVATKQDVIEWLKAGGDSRKSGAKKYLSGRIEVQDPRDFRQDQDNVIYSGPQPGEPLPAFSAVGVRGDLNGKTLNPVERAKDKPLVLIFQDNTAIGLKGIYLSSPVLTRIAEKAKQGLHVSTTFLVDDPADANSSENNLMSEIPELVEMSVSSDGRDGPGVYGLNRNVAMTIIVAKDGQVLHNFAFVQPMLYPDAYVLGGIAEAIGEKRETVADWFTEYARDNK